MEKLIVLGTGNAMVTKCYNTCFALQNDRQTLLVDAGGGNMILARLADAKIAAQNIRHLIVTHEHCDHLLGVVWVIRKIATMIKNQTYDGNFTIYCQEQLAQSIQTICSLTLQKKFTSLFGNRILFQPVTDGQTETIGAYKVTFFDIFSTKAPQYGFTLNLQNGKKLTCLGDEPYNEKCLPYVEKSDWLLSEAFCLYAEREKFKPYEKHHSTVKEACELAQKLGVAHAVLWHTEDKNYEQRKELYLAEGKQFYSGNLHVPYDLEELIL